MKIVAINTRQDKFVFGKTKSEIVNQVLDYRFEKRILFVRSDGFKETVYHSYSDEYTQDEMKLDAESFLFDKLDKFGWVIYKQID